MSCRVCRSWPVTPCHIVQHSRVDGVPGVAASRLHRHQARAATGCKLAKKVPLCHKGLTRSLGWRVSRSIAPPDHRARRLSQDWGRQELAIASTRRNCPVASSHHDTALCLIRPGHGMVWYHGLVWYHAMVSYHGLVSYHAVGNQAAPNTTKSQYTF